MKRYMQKYLSVVVAAALLLTITACSERQLPVEETKSPSEPISTSAAEPPAERTPSASDALEAVSESDLPQENVQTSEEKPAGTEFEIDTVKFKIALPDGWAAKGNEIYFDDVKIAELLPCVPNGDGKAFDALDIQYADAVTVRECTAGNYSGKYYHIQSQVSGTTAFENKLLYYLDIGDQLISFGFYPMHGIGIGTQRETFEAMLNTIGFHQ